MIGGSFVKNTIERLKMEFPDRALGIIIELKNLKDTITLTIEDVTNKGVYSIKNRDFQAGFDYTRLAEEGIKYEEQIEEIINLLELENKDDIRDTDNKHVYTNTRKDIPNYADYQVDNQVEHTLFDDWIHKRPFGFKFIRNDIIEARTWNEVFTKTCEILYEIDSDKFTHFEYLSHMNGKKKKYFSKNNKEMRKAEGIKDSIYVETNHSADTFRGIIKDMLKEYKFKVSDYKVYFWADYTELNKRDD